MSCGFKLCNILVFKNTVLQFCFYQNSLFFIVRYTTYWWWPYTLIIISTFENFTLWGLMFIKWEVCLKLTTYIPPRHKYKTYTNGIFLVWSYTDMSVVLKYLLLRRIYSFNEHPKSGLGVRTWAHVSRVPLRKLGS